MSCASLQGRGKSYGLAALVNNLLCFQVDPQVWVVIAGDKHISHTSLHRTQKDAVGRLDRMPNRWTLSQEDAATWYKGRADNIDFWAIVEPVTIEP